MEAEEILNLFYSYWFNHNIISGNKSFPFSDPKPVVFEEQHDEAQKSAFFSMQSEIKGLDVTTTKLGVRALSDRCLRIETSYYQHISSPKLTKIISGKELCDMDQKIEERAKNYEDKCCRGRRRSRGNSSRSLSELEIKEIKGFMDLGFVFTEEDKTSNLVSILPGLQRLGEISAETIKEDEDYGEVVSRPYLSEAWGAMGQKKMNKNKTVVLPWSFPDQRNDTTMKDQLKAWAHTVASTVR